MVRTGKPHEIRSRHEKQYKNNKIPLTHYST